jgi:hypothetical protein
VQAEADGAARRWRAQAPGTVSWSGARFALPAGAALRIDPLLGDVFGAQPAPGRTP